MMTATRQQSAETNLTVDQERVLRLAEDYFSVAEHMVAQHPWIVVIALHEYFRNL